MAYLMESAQHNIAICGAVIAVPRKPFIRGLFSRVKQGMAATSRKMADKPEICQQIKVAFILSISPASAL